MKKWLTTTICILCFSLLHAQEKEVVIQVVDIVSLEPLSRATVLIGKEDPIAAFTNDSGELTVFFEQGEKNKQLAVSSVGYEPVSIVIKPNTDRMVIKLKQVAVSLPGAEVFPDLPAHLLFGSKETEVLDYVVTPNYILVALFNYYRKRCYLVLLDASLNVSDEQPIPADFQKFHISGLGYIYAITPSQVFELTIRKGLLRTKYITQERFYRTIQYYCGGYENYLYLTQRSVTGQVVIFFHEDREKKVIYNYNPFCVVTNEALQRNALHEYTRAYTNDLSNGTLIRKRDMVDLNDLFPNYDPSEGDIIPGGFKTDTRFFKHEEMLKRFGAHPVYTPFFNTDSSLLIFDFCRHTANRYSYDTRPISVDTIIFDRQEGWQPMVLKNESDELFTVYKDDQQLFTICELNKRGYTTRPLATLAYQKTTNLKVSGDYVYYLHQPFANKNNVFLFREKLR